MKVIENKSPECICETSILAPVTPEFVERRIHFIRGKRVMLDKDLSELYGILVKRLNEQVQRNLGRFPPDFMFQLTNEEWQNLKSQFATSSWGGVRKSPYVFTELGVSMLSSVLNSERAVQMNIFIMRTFVKLRQLIAHNKDLAGKVDSLELDLIKQGKVLTDLYSYVKKFMDMPVPDEGKMGFNVSR